MLKKIGMLLIVLGALLLGLTGQFQLASDGSATCSFVYGQIEVAPQGFGGSDSWWCPPCILPEPE